MPLRERNSRPVRPRAADEIIRAGGDNVDPSLADPSDIIGRDISGRIVLDWRDSSHWSERQRPCIYCAQWTHLRDDAGRPAMKSCVEAALDGGGRR